MNLFTYSIILFLFVGSIALPCSATESITQEKPESFSSLKKAPNFKLPSLTESNKRVSLKQFRGKWVFINFWASWCLPCKKELPVLQKLYKKYNDNGIEILAISIDESKKEASTALKELTIDFDVALDSSNKVSQKYKVSAMPTSYLVNPEGKIIKKFQGYNKNYDKKYETIFEVIVKNKSFKEHF